MGGHEVKFFCLAQNSWLASVKRVSEERIFSSLACPEFFSFQSAKISVLNWRTGVDKEKKEGESQCHDKPYTIVQNPCQIAKL